MNDIVERLRASLSYDTPARYPEMVTEAANEIERLRALLKEARPYVADAGSDEDPETQTHSRALLSGINPDGTITVAPDWPYPSIPDDLKLDC